MIAYVKGLAGKEVLAVASSGVASLLLIGGRTVQSTFNVPIPILDDSTCRINLQPTIANAMKNTALIIWDEAAMTHRWICEAVDRSFRDVTGANLPFGGKVDKFFL